MKRLILVIIIITSVIILVKVPIIKGQTFAQACTQGLLVRRDGHIMIDTWESVNPLPFGKVGPPQTVNQPVGVTFGRSLSVNLKVCFESMEADAVLCYPLGEVRNNSLKSQSPKILK